MPDSEVPVESFLSDNCPPMGIYETLYAFRDSFGSFMGAEGTHPWSRGSPHHPSGEIQAPSTGQCGCHLGGSLLSEGVGPSGL